MAQAIFCTVKNNEQASNLVERLKTVGFTANEISVLLPDSESSKDFAIDNQTKSPEGAAVGASTGAAVGGALGWLAGIGSLAIPGVGPLIAAGPIMAALTGVAVGGAVGGVSGALIGMGIPEYEATRYVGKLKGGRCLVSVHAEDSAEISRAKRIMEEAGAEDISSSSEPSPKSASKR